jgi:hypothetical protein
MPGELLYGGLCIFEGLLHQPAARRAEHQFGGVVDVQLFDDPRTVGFHSVQAEPQQPGNLSVALTFRQQLVDLALPFREQVAAVFHFVRHQNRPFPAGQQLGHRRAEERPALQSELNGLPRAGTLGDHGETVETHRTHLMQKLNLHNTAEIVLYAVRKKIIS